MLKTLRNMKGQSTLEYAVLIVIIIGALLTIQTYIKRGVQGRLKNASDDIGDQYSPGNTNVIKSSRTHSKTEETALKGVAKTTMKDPETTNSTEQSVIANVDQEFWGFNATP